MLSADPKPYLALCHRDARTQLYSTPLDPAFLHVDHASLSPRIAQLDNTSPIRRAIAVPGAPAQPRVIGSGARTFAKFEWMVVEICRCVAAGVVVWCGARKSGAAARYLIRREIGWRSAILSGWIRFEVFARMTVDVLGDAMHIGA
jgi:hypothetical protein